MADTRARTTRRRQSGAASQRTLLAFAASTLLTAIVSLPMAYQAYLARQPQVDQRLRAETSVEVLGKSMVRQPDAVTDTLFWQVSSSSSPQLLHLATVRATPRIFLVAAGTTRADFRLDDRPVHTDTAEPFELFDGTPVQLEQGEHTLVVTVTDATGRTQLHQAIFTAAG